MMRLHRFLLSAGAALCLTAGLAAQSGAPAPPGAPGAPPPPPPPPHPADVMLAQAPTFEFISTQPAFLERTVTGAPYSAEAVSETTRVLADGTRIRNENRSKIYRDSEGRVRKEQAFGHLGFWVSEGGEAKTQVIITDPVAKRTMILNPSEKTARLLPMPPMPPAPPVPPVPPAPPGTSVEEEVAIEITTSAGAASGTAEPRTRRQVIVTSDGNATAERRIERHVEVIRGEGESVSSTSAGPQESGMFHLPGAFVFRGKPNPDTDIIEGMGEQTMQGVRATGTRRTTTIATGAIGNDRPIVAVMEEWRSPELGIVLQRTLKDPQLGETVYRLENLSRAEPLKSLFEVPSGYSVKEGQPHIERIEIRKRRDGE